MENNEDYIDRKKYEEMMEHFHEALESGLLEQIMGITLKKEDREQSRARIMKDSPNNKKKKE